MGAKCRRGVPVFADECFYVSLQYFLVCHWIRKRRSYIDEVYDRAVVLDV